MNQRAVLLAGAAIGAVVLLVVGVVFLLLHWWDVPGTTDRAEPRPVVRQGAAPLETAPQLDLATYRARKERELHGLGWVDRQRGIAHIPIETAMDILAQRGGAR